MLANQKLREFYRILNEVSSADYTLPTAPFNLIASHTEASSILTTYRCRFVKFRDVKTETFTEPARNILIVPSEEMCAAVHGSSDGWSDDTDYDDEVCILVTTEYDPSLPNSACQYLIHYLGKLGNGLGFYSTYSYNYSSGGSPININAMGELRDFGVFCKLVALMAKFQELFPIDEVYTFGDDTFQFMFTPDYHYGSRVSGLNTFIKDKGNFEPVTTGEQYLNTTGVDLTTTRSYSDGYYWLFPNLFHSNVVYCTNDSPETFTKEEVFTNTYVDSSYGMWGTAQNALDNLSGFVSDLITYIPEDIPDDPNKYLIDIPAFKEAYEALIARGKWTADNMGTSNFKSLQYKYLSDGTEYGTRVYFYKSYSALMSASALIFNKAQDVVVVNNMSDDYDGPCLMVKGWLDTSTLDDEGYDKTPYVKSYLEHIFEYGNGSRVLIDRNEYYFTNVNKTFTVGTDIAKFCIVNYDYEDATAEGEVALVDDLFFMLEQKMVFYNNIDLGPYYYRSAHIPIEFYVQACTYGMNTYTGYTYVRDGNEIANELWEADDASSELYHSLVNSMLPDYLAAHPELDTNPNLWSNEARTEYLALVQAEVVRQIGDVPRIYNDPEGSFFVMTYAADSTDAAIIEPKIIQAGIGTPFGDLYTAEGISLELELAHQGMAELYQAYVLITNYETLYTAPEPEPEDNLSVLHTVSGVRPFKFGNVVTPAVKTQSFVTINGTAPFKVTQ